MSWILIATSAAFLFAIVAIIDKFVLTHLIKKPIVPIIFYSILGIIGAFLIFLFHGISSLSFTNILLALFAGLLVSLGWLFYFRAVKVEEISRVIPLFNLMPIFVLILATIFLAEIFTPLKYLGIFLIVGGAFLISTKDFRKIKIGKAALLMLIASFLYAANTVLTKYLLEFADYWTIYAYLRLGAIFVLVPVLFIHFKDLKETLRENGRKVIITTTSAEIIFFFGALLITLALVTGPATLVNSLSNLQPFFVFLFAIVLSLFFPRILKEETKGSVLVMKIIAMVLMFVGVLLII